MSNKFVIYSGSTVNSKPPTKYFYIDEKNKNLFSYAKTLEEATNKMNEAYLGNSKWVQLVCLTTLNVVELHEKFNIHEPIFKDYYSDDDCN